MFLVAHVKSYRLEFWNQLHEALARDGIDLRVVYGRPNSTHHARQDNVVLPESYGRSVPAYWLVEKLVYHAALSELAKADLIITQNENKLLLNPLLLAMRAGGLKRIAFWGKGDVYPGGMRQANEWVRYLTAPAVDWWFPYTDSTAEQLRRQGVRCGITPVRNAIDTTGLQQDLASISEECIRAARYSLGMSSGPVGVYCGNLSPNKELEFLFDAVRLIRQAIPNFTLLVIGNGPLRDEVELIATRERAIRYLGPRIGREKALLLRMSDVFLLPGAVGLAILDSFAAGLPFLTTRGPHHGPEISYLEDGRNGLITEHDPQSFADAVVRVLSDEALAQRLRAGASASGHEYTIEAMVQNFRRGILACLAEKIAPVRSKEMAGHTIGRHA